MKQEQKTKILFATKMRGFLKHLTRIDSDKIVFCEQNNKSQFYETNSKIKMIIRNIVVSRWLNSLGIIQCIKKLDTEYDILLSYNRFMKTNKPYIIILENPTAVYHYCLGRNKTFIGRKKINQYLNDKNLKAIVCLSEACYSTAKRLIGDIPEHVIVKRIYPFIPNNPYLEEIDLKEKSYRDVFKCLYISSNFTLKSGKELIDIFTMFESEGKTNIELHIITDLNKIDEQTKEKLNNNSLIKIEDFKLTYDELQIRYKDANVLLHLSRQDSFALTILEAMKAGLPILATDIYAIPEMVTEDVNGYLIKPKYLFFGQDKMPNKEVWNNREKTIYSDYIDNNIIQFGYEEISKLYDNRSELYRLSLNSVKKIENEFSEQSIKNQWEELIQYIIEE